MWSAPRRARRRAAKRRPAFYCRIELVPLVGILITLLIIFMVNVPLPHHQIGIALAKSNHSIFLRHAIREDALRVVLLHDGRLYFGNTNISPDALPGQIRERLGNGAEQKVYLAVDARAKYGSVATVVDQVRLAGVRDISFITE